MMYYCNTLYETSHVARIMWREHMNYPPLVNVTAHDIPDIPTLLNPALNRKYNDALKDVSKQAVKELTQFKIWSEGVGIGTLFHESPRSA